MKFVKCFIVITLTSVCSLVLISCTSLAQKKTDEAIYYPALPSPPRIQFLTAFSGPNDLAGGSKQFNSFLLGEESDASSLVKKPYGVSIHDGSIYVVDTRGPGYAVFNLKKSTFEVVHGAFSGKMRKPINITIDENGDKYIADTQRRLVLVYDVNDKFVRLIGDGESYTPSDVLIINEKLYVTDLKNHVIRVLDKASGNEIKVIGKPGSAEGELFYPTNLALGQNRNIYVSETGNFRVQEFTQDGDFIASYGKVGTGVGHFARPKGIAIDRDGRMHVVDAAFENVQVLNKDGKILMFYGEPGPKRQNINLPTDIVIDYDHNDYFQKYADSDFEIEYIILIASQFGNNKVAVFGYGKKKGFDYSETNNDISIEKVDLQSLER